MARIYAGILGLVAFATVVTRGLIDAGGAGETIRQASMMMFAFATGGYAIGRIAQWIIDDSLRGRLALEAHQRPAASNSKSAAKLAAR